MQAFFSIFFNAPATLFGTPLDWEWYPCALARPFSFLLLAEPGSAQTKHDLAAATDRSI